jgi:hypothetical protein
MRVLAAIKGYLPGPVLAREQEQALVQELVLARERVLARVPERAEALRELARHRRPFGQPLRVPF